MNTPTAYKSPALTFEGLVAAIGQAHAVLAQQATKAVNISLTLNQWVIGFYIAEFELQGANRTAYGDRLVLELVAALRTQSITNVSPRQLYAYVALYRAYPQIVQTASAQSTRFFPKKERFKLATSCSQLAVRYADRSQHGGVSLGENCQAFDERETVTTCHGFKMIPPRRADFSRPGGLKSTLHRPKTSQQCCKVVA